MGNSHPALLDHEPFGTRIPETPDSQGQLTMPCPQQAARGAPSQPLPVLEGAEARAPSFLPEKPFSALVQHRPINPAPEIPCHRPLAAEHGGGQLALLRLQVPQGEPARVPAGDH